MKKSIIFLFCIFFSFISYAQEAKRKISGKVAQEGGPLKNVNVRIKNTSKGVLTNSKGKYEINAFIGDILVFSYVGFHTVEVVVDQNNVYNLDMYPAVEELEEVVVKKKKEGAFTQKDLLAEYPTNKDLIKTSTGILDKKRASFSIRMVDGSEILPIGRDFLNSLQVYFPNMIIDRDSVGGPFIYFPRTTGVSQPALFDVDGFIYEQAPTFIAPNEIDRIAVIKRNGAFSRYGPAGAGGVIIINTKEKTKVDDIGVERKYNNTNLIDSLIGKVSERKNFTTAVPDYIRKYQSVTSSDRALEIFNGQKKRYEDFAAYYLDMAKYFRNEWGMEQKAQEILSQLHGNFSNDPYTLKALAYRYEELGLKDKALKTYLEVLKIESKSAQSHRDVANAYYEIGNFEKALTNYTRYELAINSLDSVPFDKYGYDLLMATEANNIIIIHGKKLLMDDESFRIKKTSDQNVRLLFEWNHPKSDFKLQVVSPDDYYDDWNAPSAGSIERIRGYYSKQFFLDDVFKGEWKININYWGNDEKVPTYFKATVFFDYGRPSQRKWSRIFKLQEKDIDIKLFSIHTNEKTITP